MNKTSLERIVSKVTAERDRQSSLPGSEWDAKNTPGDWASIVTHYASAEVRRNGIVPNSEDYELSLVKAAAVIFAALAHIDEMKERKELL